MHTQHTIIGMAGHIDHGKTALIRALTGIETDQLPQEKERGITIDLGFAYWKDTITIIDVPGHDKFIRNMAAGVSMVDLFILVIAADDGIMPQTREHLEILKFFNVRRGIVVLNKIDLVEEDWLELVQDEIYRFMHNSGFENTPVLPVSSVTGSGIDELRQTILEIVEILPEKKSSRPFRLNIDRSFSAKGFGAVITGTVLSSELALDSRLEVLPEKFETKVRGLEVHQHETPQISTGQRAAINLSGLNKQQLRRGQVLVKPGTLDSCRELFAFVKTTALFKFKIKRLAEVRVHIGTAEIKGKINWFEEDSYLENEKEYHIHLKLAEPCAAAPGDALLLRSYSPAVTTAGGSALQINPPKLKRKQDDWQAYFQVLKDGDLSDRIKLVFKHSGNLLLSAEKIAALFFEETEKINKILQKLLKQKILSSADIDGNISYLLVKNAEILVERAVQKIEQEAQDKALKGYNFKEMQNLLVRETLSEQFLKYVLQKAVNSEKIFYDGLLYTPASSRHLQKMMELKERVEKIYQEQRFAPADMAQLAGELQISKNELNGLIQELIRADSLISIGGVYYLHNSVFQEFLEFLKEQFERRNELDIAEVRQFTGSTRKYIIPLLEFTDREGYTARDGDLRFKGNKL